MTSAGAAEMVDTHLRVRGIRDDRVLLAMLRIPREEFVPEQFRHNAYVGRRERQEN